MSAASKELRQRSKCLGEIQLHSTLFHDNIVKYLGSKVQKREAASFFLIFMEQVPGDYGRLMALPACQWPNVPVVLRSAKDKDLLVQRIIRHLHKDPKMGGCVSALHQSRGRLIKLIKAHKKDKEEAHHPIDEPVNPETFGNLDREQQLSARQIARRPRREVRRLELTEALVFEYLCLERAILRLERREVLKRFEARGQQMDELARHMAQLEATHKELRKQTDKEKADLDSLGQPSMKAFLRQQGNSFQARHERQQREYAQALGRQETAQKELDMARVKHSQGQVILDVHREQCDRLEQMHQKQEDIIWAVLVPADGGGTADPLSGHQQELDTAMEWQQRVAMAKFKWINGRVLLVHAHIQMAFGIARWRELDQMESSSVRARYFAAAEARNNFIAASQNVQSCRVYLGRVKFPYATEEEMQAMETAVQNAFNDIQSNIALKRALNICQGTHRKLGSLLQWFDKVVADTLLRDLDRANTNVIRKQKQVRETRLELFGRTVREKLGKQLDAVEVPEEEERDELEEQLLALEEKEKRPPGTSEPAEKAVGNAQQNQHQQQQLEEEDNVNAKDSIPPIPLDQLAPMPSREALFGDVQQRLAQLDQARAEMQRRNEARREKQRMALQEKLRVRKHQQKRRQTQAKDVLMQGRRRRQSSVQPAAFASWRESTESAADETGTTAASASASSSSG